MLLAAILRQAVAELSNFIPAGHVLRSIQLHFAAHRQYLVTPYLAQSESMSIWMFILILILLGLAIL